MPNDLPPSLLAALEALAGYGLLESEPGDHTAIPSREAMPRHGESIHSPGRDFLSILWPGGRPGGRLWQSQPAC